jgi:hypothetical protein
MYSELFTMVAHKTQLDAYFKPPLDGFNSDDDMSLGGESHKSGQSGLSNSSSLQTAISRSKNQEASVIFCVDICRAIVHAGAKHNPRQCVRGKAKGKCP